MILLRKLSLQQFPAQNSSGVRRPIDHQSLIRLAQLAILYPRGRGPESFQLCENQCRLHLQKDGQLPANARILGSQQMDGIRRQAWIVRRLSAGGTATTISYAGLQASGLLGQGNIDSIPNDIHIGSVNVGDKPETRGANFALHPVIAL